MVKHCRERLAVQPTPGRPVPYWESRLEAPDQERVAVAAAMGIRAMAAREWLCFAYSVTGKNLYQAMRANPGYRGIKAPRRLNQRYITEDVPTSLVPLASLGAKFGEPTRR